jgi:secreted protein with Ig-like and vWFA domain
MKIGISLKIDVTKLDKARFFRGKKGIYAELTGFIDTENVSEYGDSGTITQATSKEERHNGVKLPILGNAKIFWSDGEQNNQQATNGGYQFNSGQDDCPF